MGDVCSVKESPANFSNKPELESEFAVIDELKTKKEKEQPAIAITTTTALPVQAAPALPILSGTTNGNNGDGGIPTQPLLPLSNGQQQQQTIKAVFNKPNERVVAQNPLPGTTSSHKESVFMKMNKRLSALELNISLGNEHLAELNRRHSAQSEELSKQHERVVKASQDHTYRTTRSIQNIQNEILAMRQDTTQLRTALGSLEEEKDGWKKAANKFKVENRQLKQDIRDLQEAIAQISREIGELSRAQRGGSNKETLRPALQRTVALRYDPIRLP